MPPALHDPDREPARGVPLTQLPDGARGVARTCALPCEECELLAAMGLCDRCPIRVCRRGRAWIVHARSTRLALSNQLAERITVEEPPAIAC